MSTRNRRTIKPTRVILYMILVVAAAFFLVPVYILLVTSLKSYADVNLATMWELPRHLSLDSFIRNDLKMAEEVRRTEQITDDLNEQIFRELLTFMMEDPRKIHACLIIMQISKNLERISDHATGIADMVIYMITGQSVRHQPSCETPGND